MASADHSSPGWRSSGRRPEVSRTKSPTLRRIQAIVVVLLLLACLVAFLAWLLCPMLGLCGKERRIVLASIVSLNVGKEFPHPLFVAQDAAAWQALQGSLASPRAASVEQVSIEDCRTKNFDVLVGKLRAQRLTKNDALLCYVCAAGYVEGDAATGWFITSGGRADDPSQRLSIDGLLQQFHDLETSAVKVLLLDVGRVEPDSRDGSLVNLFPRAVESAIQRVAAAKRGASPLWVIASNTLFEKSAVSPRDRRSAFSYFATTGLAGAADLDRNGNVTLQELYGHIDAGVEGYGRSTAGLQGDRAERSQRPQLWRCGDGAAQADQNGLERLREEAGNVVVVAHYTPLPADGQNAAELPDEPKAPAPTAEPPKPAATAGGQAAGQEKAEPPPPEQPSERALYNLRAQLASLRTLQQQPGAAPWMAHDFAPHLARVIDERLVAAQLACLEGQSAPNFELDADVERVTNELDGWRRQFGDANSARPRYEQEPQILRAVQLRNRVLSNLPNHILYCRLAGDKPDWTDAIPRLVALIEQLEDPQTREQSEKWPQRQQEQWLRQLDLAAKALEEKTNSFATNGWRVDSAAPELGRLLAVARTPLWERAQWEDVQRRLGKLPALSSVKPAVASPRRPDPVWEGKEAQRLQNHLRQESALLHKLARDTDSAAPSDPEMNSGTQLSWESLVLLHKQAEELRRRYEQLPERVLDPLQARGDAAVEFVSARRAETLARQVHVSDVRRLALKPENGIPFAMPRIRRIEHPPREFVVVANPESGSQEFSRVAPREVAWTVRDSARGFKLPAELRVTFPNLPESIRIQQPVEAAPKEGDKKLGDKNGPSPAASGNPAPTPPEPKSIRSRDQLVLPAGGTEVALKLLLMPLPACKEATEVKFTIAAPGYKPLEIRYQIKPPKALTEDLALSILSPHLCLEKPDKPDEALQWGHAPDNRRTLTARLAPHDVFRLLPFARGTTSFEFALVNNGTTEREVTYQLFVVPNQPRRCAVNPLRHFDRAWDAARNKKALLVERQLKLKPNESVPLSFTPPAPPAAAGAAPAAAAPPAAPARLDLTGGLVIALTEPGSELLVLLDLSPLHPKRYVDWVQDVRNDKGLVAIKVQPLDGGAGLLPDGYEVAWDLSVWDPSDTRRPSGASVQVPVGQGRADITAAIGHLNPDLAPKDVRLALKIDGYPRAFNIDARIQNGQLVGLERLDRKLSALAMPNRIVKNKADLQNENGAKAKVDFAVDFPRAERDKYKFDIAKSDVNGSNAQELDTFYLDRVWEIRQAPSDNPGTLSVTTTVSDPSHELVFRSGSELKVVGAVRRVDGGRVDDVSDAECRITVDEGSPVITSLQPPPKSTEDGRQFVTALRGQRLRIVVQAADEQTGVTAVKCYKDEKLTDSESSVDVLDLARGIFAVTIPLPREPDAPRPVRWFVATDGAGNTSEPTRLEIHLQAPPPAPGRPAVTDTGAPPDGSVSGVIEHSRGKAYNWPVVLSPRDDNGKTLSGQTDTEGRFRIEGPPGQYILRATGSNGMGKATAEKDVTIAPGQETPLKDPIRAEIN